MRRRQFTDGAYWTTERSSAVVERRRLAATLCLDRASDALSGFGRGCHVFGLSKGQFSCIDIAAAVLAITGLADVACWTWCIAEYEVEAVTAFLMDRRIERFRMVMDVAGAQRDMPLIGEIQARFGLDCLRFTRTHAKIVTVSTGCGWRVVIRGSMNLNANPRMEQFDVSDCAQTYDVVEGLMDELWASAAVPARALTSARASEVFAGLGEAGAPRAAWAPSATSWFGTDTFTAPGAPKPRIVRDRPPP